MTWRELAACAGHDIDLFFRGENVWQARLICGLCPVRDECLDDALTVPVSEDYWGVRGGLTANERAELRRNGVGERRRAIPVRDVKHGTRYAYEERGCRCDECKETQRQKGRARRGVA